LKIYSKQKVKQTPQQTSTVFKVLETCLFCGYKSHRQCMNVTMAALFQTA